MSIPLSQQLYMHEMVTVPLTMSELHYYIDVDHLILKALTSFELLELLLVIISYLSQYLHVNKGQLPSVVHAGRCFYR